MGGGGSFTAPLTGTGVLTPGTIRTITDDTKYNAWPQIVRLSNGSLMMAYTKGDSHNNDNTGKIVGRVATEANAILGTWGAEFDIADETLGAINVSLGSLASGRVVAVYNLYDFTASPTTPVDAVRVRYSDDFGSTWSSAYTVNSAFTGTCSNGTAHLIQKANGTVMMAVYGKNSGATYYSASVFSSTDDGATWGSELIVSNGPGDSRQYYEPSLTLLDDGTILFLTRNDDSLNMFQQRSTDGGATWTNPAVAFAGLSPGNAVQLPSGTLISPVRDSTTLQLVASTSLNDGTTWATPAVLASGFFENEYACPVPLTTAYTTMIVYSVQPTSALTNADIKTIVVTEGTTPA